MKRFIRAYLRRRGLGITKMADPEAVRSFIRLLRPVDAGHELIRIGGDGDGGYLVPNDMEGITHCFSPGVGDVSTFESALADRYGIRCHMADYSVDEPKFENSLLDFEKKFIGNHDDDRFMRLSTWLDRKAGDDDDLMLQMDIEGGEYPVLIDASADLLNRFRIVVAEFHSMDMIAGKYAETMLRAIMEKMLEHFAVVHIHPNNASGMAEYEGIAIPDTIEVTFLRRDRVRESRPVQSLPHPLDMDNVDTHPSIDLPEIWWKQ